MQDGNTYTTEQLKRGEGLYADQATQIASYDGGKTWYTASLSENFRGNPTHHYTIPAGGTWRDRQ